MAVRTQLLHTFASVSEGLKARSTTLSYHASKQGKIAFLTTGTGWQDANGAKYSFARWKIAHLNLLYCITIGSFVKTSHVYVGAPAQNNIIHLIVEAERNRYVSQR